MSLNTSQANSHLANSNGDTQPAAGHNTSPPQPTTPPFPISMAIIGASLSGLSLALALLRSNLFPASAITIYDLRPSPEPTPSTATANPEPDQPHPQPSSGFNPSTTASGIILTPNGLSVLAHLGVFDLIKPHCWTATHRTFRSDPGDRLVKKVRISGEEAGYGFGNHRLWRSVLLGELLGEVERRGVGVRWGWRFEGVLEGELSEVGGQEGGVRFRVSQRSSDGSGGRVEETQSAGMLVGADGIYSTVRKYLDPEAKPIYTGTTGVLAHIKWDDVDWPLVTTSAQTADSASERGSAEQQHPYERQCTLQGTPGALFWLPEDPQGSVIMIGKQTRMPEPTPTSPGQSTREAWEVLSQDKSFLTKFYRDGYDEWGSTGRKIIDAVCDENKGRGTLYLWPFMRMEKLEKWFIKSPSFSTQKSSGGGTVLILGDAAHALPPSSGQGVNQTLEDVYTLSKILELVKNGQKHMNEALKFWQDIRQDRIEDVYDWATGVTNVDRLSKREREEEQAAKKAKVGSDGKGEKKADDMRWLYLPKWDETINHWATQVET